MFGKLLNALRSYAKSVAQAVENDREGIPNAAFRTPESEKTKNSYNTDLRHDLYADYVTRDKNTPDHLRWWKPK